MNTLALSYTLQSTKKMVFIARVKSETTTVHPIRGCVASRGISRRRPSVSSLVFHTQPRMPTYGMVTK